MRSTLQIINYTGLRRVIPEQRRRKARRMIRQTCDLIPKLLNEGTWPIDFHWEWPAFCEGWSDVEMIRFLKELQKRGVQWRDCRIDGCRYLCHLKTPEGDLVKKTLEGANHVSPVLQGFQQQVVRWRP